MYPPQTSLIPVTVALVRFFEERGFSAFFINYPYWYLSSTPYRYLTGPIIPIVSVTLHKLFSNVSLFDITIWLVIVTYLFSAFGWLVLFNRLTGYRSNKFTIYHLPFTIFLIILPWRLFSALALNEASFTIARNFLPWVLLAFWGAIGGKTNRTNKTYRNIIIAVISLVLLLLINTSILPIFLVGLTSLVLASSFKEGKFRGIIRKVKLSLSLILYSLLLVTLWYTPGYWWTLFTNPSIGGASGVKVFFRILDLLKASIPLILAVIAVYFSGKIKNRLAVFVLIWILSFGFLTLFRFIGDPDFWMDWTTWFYELEVGVALLLFNFTLSISGRLKTRNDKFQITNDQLNSKVKFQNSKPQVKSQNYLLLSFTFILLLLSFYLTWRIHLALGKPALVSQEIPQGVQSLEKLAEIAGDGSTSLTTSRVFLSGSTVFWANALYNIYQLRGGRDQVAVHRDWDKAAYELREGGDSEASIRWLHELEISYVLVHGPKSGEFYHDFKSINKWRDIGRVVWEADGDIIYEISAKEQE